MVANNALMLPTSVYTAPDVIGKVLSAITDVAGDVQLASPSVDEFFISICPAVPPDGNPLPAADIVHGLIAPSL